MPRMMRNLLFALGCATFAGLAGAQTFPAKPITIICPFPPGASADAALRSLAQAMAKELGQNVIVDNRPGAAGTLGPASLASAQPNGYTLSLVTNTLIRQPFIVKTPYDPAKDFTYLAGVSAFDFGLVVDTSSPWKTFDEFVGYAQKNPGKISFGTIGIGSAPHQVLQRFGDGKGIVWTHIPYKGSAPALTDLQGGHVQAVSDTSSWAQLVDSGKLRLLAVYSSARLKHWPNVATLKEMGSDIVESSPWGIVGPKGLDPKVAKTLQDSIRKAMDDPGFLKTLDSLGMEPRYMASEEYDKYMQARIPIEKAVVEKYHLKEQ